MKNSNSTPETENGMDTKVFDHIRDTLNSMFDIDKNKITPEARLYEDLDIDSIDAVDLVVELKSFTGSRINPDDFKSVRTIQDVVSAVERLMKP
ncbi:acyl carrier protein [Granulosicoccus antarcticus]|uniref:Acyl carrier protein n=1 Tax=Granulosicoccus antarcticus IMCC3135 TaxID=1192854 RepID=A0A2Z2NZY6_9GAMM|nr:acyl carrier protein [Granulosicoccus antarcticus]ASJ76849.1 Acyl carrier protein [Granulosicoccus antarcticus IMCC3135]